MAERTIDDVLLQLDEIIAAGKRERHVFGYFAALYRRVTAAVKEAIQERRFDNNERMEQLDVAFANRYLEAWQQYRRGERPTMAWRYTFRTGDKRRGLIIQHLLLGMNAHINLDLAVAAAQTAPGAAYPALKADFMRINAILGSLYDDTERALMEAAPLLKLVNRLAQKGLNEAVCNFSIAKARQAAWDSGKRLSILPPKLQALEIDALDHGTTLLGGMIYNPAQEITSLYKTIRRGELRDVPAVIELIERTIIV